MTSTAKAMSFTSSTVHYGYVKYETVACTVPIAEELRRDLIVRFLAEIMQMTGSPKDQAEFQAALQSYRVSLHPWLDASDDPLNPGAVFTLLECYTFDETGDNITVVLSPNIVVVSEIGKGFVS